MTGAHPRAIGAQHSVRLGNHACAQRVVLEKLDERKSEHGGAGLVAREQEGLELVAELHLQAAAPRLARGALAAEDQIEEVPIVRGGGPRWRRPAGAAAASVRRVAARALQSHRQRNRRQASEDGGSQ